MNPLLHLPILLAQIDESPALPDYQPAPLNPVAAGVMGFIYLVVIILLIASMWKIFTKAGRPGWAAIIPIYNIIVLWQITGKPGWVLALALIPCTAPVGMIILAIGVAQSFGKTAGFGIGLALLPFIFYPILGFGDARYQAPVPALA
jgi:hypothetical protein